MTNKESTKLDKIETTLNKLVGSLVGVNASDGFINRTNNKFTKLFDVIADVKLSMVSKQECKETRKDNYTQKKNQNDSKRWLVITIISIAAIGISIYSMI